MRIRPCTLIILVLLLSFSSPAQGLKVERIADLLDKGDVERAWEEIKDERAEDAELLELKARVAFYRGDYTGALKSIKTAIRLVSGGQQIERSERWQALALFIEQTRGVTDALKGYESDHFSIKLDEGQDAFLIHYLREALERTYRAMAGHYGFRPEVRVRVELFPSTKSFYYGSTLSIRDIEVTGAVGLAKFNKLMLISPRALLLGYRWLDAISHEYIHHMIVKLTANRAPIWFHEGLAKYEEARWRQANSSYLSPLYQTMLSRAIKEGRLIPFKMMEPSLVKLKTPEEVQLAYAEAASAIDFIVSTVGYPGLRDILKGMAGSSAQEAIRQVMGLSFDEFEGEWRQFLQGKGLNEVEGVQVRRHRVKVGNVSEERMEMEEIKSLVARNRAHLGDLLKERGRMRAASREYGRALRDSPNSVLIVNKLAMVQAAVGKREEAIKLLRRSTELSPDHPTAYAIMGRLLLMSRRYEEGAAALQQSLQINPFDPQVHRGLANAYEMLGDKERAIREAEIAERLSR